MDTKTLQNIGLNETQSRAYIYLVKKGSTSPPDLASALTIKRPTAYAVLDQLVDMQLANKKDINKKFTYSASNPVSLEKLARKHREEAHEHERTVQSAMPTLFKFFHTFSDQPGVKFYQGIDGIKEIYNDTLRTCKDIYVFRSAYDQDLLSTEFFNAYKQKRANLGITTYMINPSNDPKFWNDKTDEIYKIERTPISPEAYTANTEISSYGEKVSIISFGDEAMGMIIISPQIAKAIREIYKLCQND